jgi:hypothetical protein
MELVVEPTSVHVALASGIGLLVLLIALMVADVRTRAAPPFFAPGTATVSALEAPAPH